MRLMSTLETPTRWTPTATTKAVVVPRRHVFAIAILMCVPLPLLSVAAMVVPLPQIVERATATFIAIAAPVAGNHSSLIREKPVAARSVEITYRPAEKAPAATARPVARVRARSQTPPYVGHARRPSAKVAVQTDAGGTRAGSRDPDSRPVDEPGDAAPPEKADPPGRPEPPTDGEPPTGGGGVGGGGSGGNSGGGSSTGGGGSEPAPPDPPGQGGDPRGSGGGSDKVEPPATDTGPGSPPALPSPPGSGNGKP